MKVTLWILSCAAMILGGTLLPAVGAPVGAASQIVLVVAGIIGVMAGLAVATFMRLYVRTKANEAFVRTGNGGARVILDGGSIVVPFLHETVRVPLETMRLDVDRTGGDALITADKLRADLKAEFYIRVQPNRDEVLNAARSLGEKTFNLRSIEELVKDKLISTLRAVAATRTLDELNAKREEFASETKRAVEADLRHNGLTLETVTVSKLDQTDPALLNPKNVFDAQGLRRIAEITQSALVQRNEIERDAEQARIAKDVATRQRVLDLERTRAEAEASQSAEVSRVRAERETEAANARITMEQAVAEREIAKARAVEIAGRERQVAVALAESKRVAAEQHRLVAEALREREAQNVKTVEVTAQAEREGEQKLIAARKAAEQDRYRKQVDADVIAYSLQKAAEGKKAAAEAEFQAKTRMAQADAESAKMRAQGETALQMVAVNVARSQVEVDATRVEVERQRVDVEACALGNREKYGRAGIELELGKLRINASKEAQVAAAQALAQFLARANFTLFGDPESADRMVQSYMRGMGLGRTLDGFVASLDGDTKGAVAQAGTALFSAVESIAGRLAPEPTITTARPTEDAE